MAAHVEYKADAPSFATHGVSYWVLAAIFALGLSAGSNCAYLRLEECASS